MLQEDIVIRRLVAEDKIPYDLLLLADPSLEAVDDYLERGICYLALGKDKIIGVYILLKTRPFIMELVNLAVGEEWQGKGVGKALIRDAVVRAKEWGANTLALGTGNSSLQQLGLYQKSGFRIVGVERDFFVRHYNEVIIENGIQCIDMIRLHIEL